MRTRQALLAAARQLMEQGIDPSIDAVAEIAMVSRATAYRYFASAEKLILEATLDAAFDNSAVDFTTLRGSGVADRVGRVQAYLYDNAKENEVRYRLFLCSAHKEWVESGGKSDLRGGRRLPMIEKALEPIRERLDEPTYERLFYALAGMMGIDSLVMMRDVCKLEHNEAKSVMGWAVRTLVDAVLDAKAPTGQ